MLSYAVPTILVLGLVIFVHELGHYWAARAMGVGVERFSIGFGPRIWGFKRGDTEYILGLIPLGGYVRMQGMEDEVMEHLEGGADGEESAEDAAGRPRPAAAGAGRTRVPDPGDYDGKSVAARALVISAGVIMNVLFALVLFISVAAIWGYQDVPTTRVMAIDETLLPDGAETLAQMSPGAEIASIGEAEPETWGEVGNAFMEAPEGSLTVRTRSPAAAFEVAVPVDPDERVRIVQALQFWVDPVVGRIEGGSAADDASLETGDRVTSVAGIPVANWHEMVREVAARPGERVEIGVVRDGTALTRAVALDSVSDDGETRGRLGVYQLPVTVTVPMGLGQAFVEGWRTTIDILGRIVGFLADLVTLDVSPREVGSIGTIAVASGEAASQGMSYFLRFIALFSLNLAVLNLLPIPVLDGGHLVFLGLELVRGRKLSVEQRVRWSKAGLWILLAIMVWALGNDLLRFVGL